jgi:hypothetical protein
MHMNSHLQLAPSATAQLSMAAGNPCSIAEFAMYLEQFDYTQPANDPNRWVLNDPDTRSTSEPPAIIVHDLNGPVVAMEVHGEGIDHFTNLNYLMQRSGWQSCEVVCRTGEISAKMLARFVSVEVKTDFTIPASSLDQNQSADHPTGDSGQPGAPSLIPSAVSHPQQASSNDANARDSLEDLENATHQVRQLTIQLNAAQEQASVAEAEIVGLRRQVDQLKAQLAVDAHPATTNEVQGSSSHHLMSVIEKYLLPTIDVADASAELLADLRGAGYTVQMRLVRATG